MAFQRQMSDASSNILDLEDSEQESGTTKATTPDKDLKSGEKVGRQILSLKKGPTNLLFLRLKATCT